MHKLHNSSTSTGRLTMHTQLAAHEWVKKEIDEWGFDYIEFLFADGYEPTLTSLGWRWVQTTPSATAQEAQ